MNEKSAMYDALLNEAIRPFLAKVEEVKARFDPPRQHTERGPERRKRTTLAGTGPYCRHLCHEDGTEYGVMIVGKDERTRTRRQSRPAEQERRMQDTGNCEGIERRALQANSLNEKDRPTNPVVSVGLGSNVRERASTPIENNRPTKGDSPAQSAALSPLMRGEAGDVLGTAETLRQLLADCRVDLINRTDERDRLKAELVTDEQRGNHVDCCGQA
jgi:hypothetical protein